ncbi:MAG: VOC family protein [Pseudomonadota bacterium]
MLADKEVMATISVSDIARAKVFYGETLGLRQSGSEGEQVVSYNSGNATLLIYQSSFAGSNKATAATWTVAGELADIVQALKARGVAFEHYTMPGLTLEGDIHIGDHMKLAWFKDPDGNILNIVGT